jgi:hypothetical protein
MAQTPTKHGLAMKKSASTLGVPSPLARAWGSGLNVADCVDFRMPAADDIAAAPSPASENLQ